MQRSTVDASIVARIWLIAKPQFVERAVAGVTVQRIAPRSF